MGSIDQASTAQAVLECEVAVIGAGPAGLMVAERLAAAGVKVSVFDGKASAGRKFLLAGKGGLNLTHSEDLQAFVSRFGERSAELAPWLQAFGPQQVCDWAEGLGVETFVGSSGRVFPKDMKAAPLLRAWLTRLRSQGVQFHMRHRWLGWQQDGVLMMASPTGPLPVKAKAVVLATGGGSWARLGSDGAWVPLLQERGVDVAALQPANCGFELGVARQPQAERGETRRAFLAGLFGQSDQRETGWSAHFAERYAGQPFKSVALHFEDPQGQVFERKGEFVATANGVEGSLIYAVSAALRDTIASQGSATFTLDLLPALSFERVLVEVRHPRGSRSLSSHLKSRLNLDGIKMAALHEVLSKQSMADPVALAHAIKALPLTVVATSPMDDAISTAGGVRLQALDQGAMCQALPGVFCAGEMLDWEAPTGGYLLTACLSSGVHAAQGVLAYLGVAGVEQSAD